MRLGNNWWFWAWDTELMSVVVHLDLTTWGLGLHIGFRGPRYVTVQLFCLYLAVDV